MSLYDDLGVAVDADAAEVKRAYKRRASKSHPDKGGSKEEFQVVQRAYTVLSDETKRKRYDETGQDNELPNIEAAAQSQLATMFAQLLENSDPDTTDFVEKLRQVCINGQQQAQQLLRKFEAKTKKLETAKKRLGRKKKATGVNFLAFAIEQQIKSNNAQLEQGKQNIALGDEMLKLLADYEYSADTAPSANNPLVRPDTLFTFSFTK